MKKNIKDIKKELKNNNLVYWFNIKNNKGILISKGLTKNDASNNLIDKINSNTRGREKYMDSKLWRLTITFHKPEKSEKIIFGDILIKVENYIVVEKKDKIIIKKDPEIGKTGNIWFKKNWLEYNDWDNKYIINIVNKLSSTRKLKLTAPNIYHLLF